MQSRRRRLAAWTSPFTTPAPTDGLHTMITVQVVNDLGMCWGADYVVAPRVNADAKLLVEEKR